MRSSFKTVPPGHWQRAQQLRKQPSAAEKAIWQALRYDQLGVRFRRQHPIGPFIADFYCAECRLVIEIDGDSHYTPEQVLYDQERDSYMIERGLLVKRFTNSDALQSLDEVVEELRRLIVERRMSSTE